MAGPTVVKMAEVARSQVGVREGPRNNETKYGAWYGMNFVAWCAIFCSWCAWKAQANYLGKPWRFSSTITARDHAKKNKRWTTTPRVGSVAMMAHTSTTGHVGFVIAINKDGSITTVEGNTNDQGSREGNGVWIRTRARSSWDGYILLDETLTDTPTPTPPTTPQEEEEMGYLVHTDRGAYCLVTTDAMIWIPDMDTVNSYKSVLGLKTVEISTGFFNGLKKGLNSDAVNDPPA